LATVQWEAWIPKNYWHSPLRINCAPSLSNDSPAKDSFTNRTSCSKILKWSPKRAHAKREFKDSIAFSPEHLDEERGLPKSLKLQLQLLSALQKTMAHVFEEAPEPPTELGRYRILSGTAGVRVSPLCLGALSIGNAWEGVSHAPGWKRTIRQMQLTKHVA
jgi:hypothetical protein